MQKGSSSETPAHVRILEWVVVAGNIHLRGGIYTQTLGEYAGRKLQRHTFWMYVSVWPHALLQETGLFGGKCRALFHILVNPERQTLAFPLHWNLHHICIFFVVHSRRFPALCGCLGIASKFEETRVWALAGISALHPQCTTRSGKTLHTHTHIHTHTQIQTDTRTHIRIRTCTHTHIRACTDTIMNIIHYTQNQSTFKSISWVMHAMQIISICDMAYSEVRHDLLMLATWLICLYWQRITWATKTKRTNTHTWSKTYTHQLTHSRTHTYSYTAQRIYMNIWKHVWAYIYMYTYKYIYTYNSMYINI